jgi:hypothetical protein
MNPPPASIPIRSLDPDVIKIMAKTEPCYFFPYPAGVEAICDRVIINQGKIIADKNLVS